MIHPNSQQFLQEVDPNYFKNTHLTSFDIYNRKFVLPKDQTFFKNITRVRFVNCMLTNVPEGINNYKEITMMCFPENQISKIKIDFFLSFPKLTILDLSSNKLKTLYCKLPETLVNIDISYNKDFDLSSIWVQNLKSLSILKAMFCNLNELPDNVPVFHNTLTNLILDGNNFKVIPQSVNMFDNLEELSLFGNEIDDLQNFEFKYHIKSLNISYNKIQNIKFLDGTKINILECSSNFVEGFPPSLLSIIDIQFIHLEHMNVSGELDVELPKTLLGIDLSNNEIEKFSEKFVKSLTNLMFLKISFNKLNEVPDCFDENSKLSKVYFDNNKLTSLPPSFWNLQQIEQISLQNNNFTEIGEFNWPKLNFLNFSFNSIKSLPNCFQSSVCLNDINLSFNQLDSLPSSLSCCRKVSSFLATNNNFISIPQCVMSFSQIKTLSFGGNRLTSLPSGFGALFFLRFLDLSNNNFSDFPSSIFQIRSLKSLSLSHNAITEIPSYVSSILDETPPTLVSFPDSLNLLDLSFNKLKTFPSAQLLPSSLTSLNLDYNQITGDFDISHLKNLKYFSLSCNPNIQASLVDIIPSLLQNNEKLDNFEYLGNEVDHVPKGQTKIHLLANKSQSISKKFGIGYASTIGSRTSMEDAVALEDFPSSNSSLFVICDGHYGPKAAATITHILPYEFKSISNKLSIQKERIRKKFSPQDIKEIIYDLFFTWIEDDIPRYFTNINNSLKSLNINDGCTVAAVFIHNNIVYTLGIGDSRIVRVRKKTFERMTTDHKPLDREEFERLRKTGLSVSKEGRINKKLAVARALGDFWCEQEGLYVPPSITTFKILKPYQKTRDDCSKNPSFLPDNSNISCSSSFESISKSQVTNFHNSFKPTISSQSTTPVIKSLQDTPFDLVTNPNQWKNKNTTNDENVETEDLYISEENGDNYDIGLIIACDGLWDVVSDEIAADIVRNSKTAADAAVRLKNTAFGLQSQDNISVIVILFKAALENKQYVGLCPVNTVDILPKYVDPDDID